MFSSAGFHKILRLLLAIGHSHHALDTLHLRHETVQSLHVRLENRGFELTIGVRGLDVEL